jgi:thioredoxin-related protein
MKTNPTFATCLALLTLAVASLITSRADAVDEGWTVSFAEAKAQAAKEGKSILMEFTGSDWCPPCKALHKNVLSKEVFKTEAPKNFILLKLDNPRDKSKQSLEEQAQYRTLSAQYKITGVPTIILADDQGRPYHRQVGYSGDPAAKYVADLTQKSTILAKRNEFLAKADQAEGVERAKLLDQAIALIDSDLAIATYGDTVREIIKLDADGSAGLKAKYEGVLQTSEIKTALTEIQKGVQNGTPDQAIAKLDKLIADKKPTGEGLQEVLFLKSSIKFQSGDKEAAQKLLNEAKAAAPSSKRATKIDQILKKFFEDGK